MRSLFIYSFIFITGIFFSGCENNFQSRDFPSVLTQSVGVDKDGSLLFSGELISRGSSQIEEVGFIWDSNEDPDMSTGFRANLANTVKEGPFNLRVYTSIRKDVTYYVKAYAKTKDLTVYGDTWNFISPVDFQPPELQLSPVTGHAGDTVVISGGLFSRTVGRNSVKVNNIEAEIIEVKDSSLTVVIPLTLDLLQSQVSVTCEGLTSSLADKFTLITPTITSFSPEEVEVMDTIQIFGTGFHSNINLNKVYFGETSGRIVSVSPSKMSVIVPFPIDSLCNITVSVSGQQTISAKKILIHLPDIGYYSPTIGSHSDTLFIYCRDIDPALVTSVTLGDFNAPIIRKEEATIYVTVPNNLNKKFSKLVLKMTGWQFEYPVEFELKQPEITGTSETMLVNNSTVIVYGTGFSSIPSMNKLALKYTDTGNEYYLTPLTSSPSSLNVKIYNHLTGSNLPSGIYQIGIKTTETVIWSELTITITDMWRRLGDFPGGERYKCGAFAVNGKGYAGLGTRTGNDIKKDLWEFDPDNEQWLRVADFPGNARILPCVFVNSTEAFVGGGQSIDNSSTQVPYYDFYKYTPATNSWAKVSDAPSVEKSYPGASASPSENIHVANLSSSIVNEYNSLTNIWTQTYTGIAAENRQPQTFSINGKAYFIGGGNNQSMNGTTSQVWEYDPVSKAMTRKKDFVGASRYGGFSFSIGNYGYIGCGVFYIYNVSIIYLTDVYRYDPSNDSWTNLQSFPGGFLHVPVSFVIGKKAYILTGNNTSSLTGTVWEFYDPFNN